jgi:hypothetical protein
MSLATIRQLAMDRVDEQDNPTTGKFSVVWWNRQINVAKDILADRTGFYQIRHSVTLPNHTQIVSLPSNLCWGITAVYLGRNRLSFRSGADMEDEYAGWRFASDLPNQPGANGDGITIVSSSAADTTQKVTVSGLVTSGAYVSEELTLTGKTPVTTSSAYITEVWRISLDTAAAGDVTATLTSGATTVAVIAAGDLYTGEAIVTAQPGCWTLEHPNLLVDSLANQDYTLWVLGGSRPADLASDGSLVTGLPLQFEWVIAEGAAALAENSDLYDQAQSARMSSSGQAFWAGVERLNEYLLGLNHDRMGAIRLDPSPYFAR